MQKISVIKLKHISNVTDIDALSIHDDVEIQFVTERSQIGDEDLIIIPGSAPVIPLSTYGFPYENKTTTNYGTYEKNKEIQQLLDNKNKEISKVDTYYAPRLPDKKITQDTRQKVEKSVVKKENKKFEYVNNSKYEIKVIGEVQNDVAKKVEGVVRRIQEEEKQRLRAEIGGNYTQAGGLE